MYTDTVVKLGLLLLVSARSEACLDLLVRSFNQIFTPVIETSENRVHKSHKVDDLTRFYKRDRNGNFVLRDDKWLSANPFVKDSNLKEEYRPSARSLFEHLNMAGRNVPDQEEDIGTSYGVEKGEIVTSNNNRSNDSIPKGRSMESEDDDGVPSARKIQIGVPDYEYEDEFSDMEDDIDSYGRRPRYYVPGDRPFLDFLIKVLEMFQVGLEATPHYIVPHAKDKFTKSRIKFRSSNESDPDSDSV